MMTQFSDIYGIRGTEWEYMVNKALDTLDEFNHVPLAIYPCGSCLFDLPTAKPELICFYGEEADYLLNPAKIDLCPRIDASLSGKIHFRSLYKIGKDLSNLVNPVRDTTLGVASVYLAEPFFEEDLFLRAKYKLADIVKKHFLDLNDTFLCLNYKGSLEEYLLIRTCYIYSITKNIVTNHKGYDISDILSSMFSKKDLEIANDIYNNVHGNKEAIIRSGNFLLQKIRNRNIQPYEHYDKQVQELGKIIKEFYILEL